MIFRFVLVVYRCWYKEKQWKQALKTKQLADVNFRSTFKGNNSFIIYPIDFLIEPKYKYFELAF